MKTAARWRTEIPSSSFQASEARFFILRRKIPSRRSGFGSEYFSPTLPSGRTYGLSIIPKQVKAVFILEMFRYLLYVLDRRDDSKRNWRAFDPLNHIFLSTSFVRDCVLQMVYSPLRFY